MEDSEKLLIVYGFFGLLCLALGVRDIVDQLVKTMPGPTVSDETLRSIFGLAITHLVAIWGHQRS